MRAALCSGVQRYAAAQRLQQCAAAQRLHRRAAACSGAAAQRRSSAVGSGGCRHQRSERTTSLSVPLSPTEASAPAHGPAALLTPTAALPAPCSTKVTAVTIVSCSIPDSGDGDDTARPTSWELQGHVIRVATPCPSLLALRVAIACAWARSWRPRRPGSASSTLAPGSSRACLRSSRWTTSRLASAALRASRRNTVPPLSCRPAAATSPATAASRLQAQNRHVASS